MGQASHPVEFEAMCPAELGPGGRSLPRSHRVAALTTAESQVMRLDADTDLPRSEPLMYRSWTRLAEIVYNSCLVFC